jgi:hypothetical protein
MQGSGCEAERDCFSFVIPAKAGIQGRRSRHSPWIPTLAGMTAKKEAARNHQ